MLSTARQSHAVAVAHATALLLAGHVVAVAAPPGSEALGVLEAATAGAMVGKSKGEIGIHRVSFMSSGVSFFMFLVCPTGNMVYT